MSVALDVGYRVDCVRAAFVAFDDARLRDVDVVVIDGHVVARIHGADRIPTLLRRVDQLARRT